MKTLHTCKQYNLVKSILIIGLSATFGLTACQKEGPAEKAGQKIDRAAEKAKQEIEQATKSAQQSISASKDTLEQKTDQAEKNLDQSKDNSKALLEKTEQSIDHSTDVTKQKIENVNDEAEKKLEVAKESVINKAEIAENYVDDSVITLKVKAAISTEPLLKESQIEVTTANGLVKLSGSVDTEQSIGKAIDISKNMKGVKSVQTDLVVKINTLGK